MNKIQSKKDKLACLSNQDGMIGALAIDQRGALRKMFQAAQFDGDLEQAAKTFKALVAEELTPYATAIVLDPEYGLEAAKKRDRNCGLLLAYEQTGYDTTHPGRFPDLLEEWSVWRMKQIGVDAVKFLLYYDVDENPLINQKKQVLIERIGAECSAYQLPFFLELLSYDTKLATDSREFAKVKPHKVNTMMREFSNAKYQVDVLKVEVPVNMDYVADFAMSNNDVLFSKEQAQQFFIEQNQATELPFIFLSAGVSTKMFQHTLRFASEAGSSFSGVLCGRATWKDAVPIFIKHGQKATRRWLQTQGRQNMIELNEILRENASSCQ